MAYSFNRLRWQDVRAVAEWRYPEPYSFYNLGFVPLLTSVALDRMLAPFGLLGYYGVWLEQCDLVGIFSFYRQSRTVEIGLALRPDLTGGGRGLAFVEAGLDFGRQRFAPEIFRLDVASFNQRAINVYQRAGFTRSRHFIRRTRAGLIEFMEMLRPA